MTARGIAAVAIVIAVMATPSAALAGHTFLPPAGRVWTGLSGSHSADLFTMQVGKPPAVFGTFTYFGASFESAFADAQRSGARPMLHISTALFYGQPEVASPLGIARGQVDDYLVALNHRMQAYGKPTYIRLMAEMNQTNNAYCAFNKDGSSRGKSHSTANFKQAFRRAALILRGGSVAAIDARLHALELPGVQGVKSGSSLPRPLVSMLWVPQSSGTPAIAANSAAAYYPGNAYVDWVGTDFYGKFPNFSGLQNLYDEYPTKPFAFGEWALWDRDDPGFVQRFFDFVKSHPRVRMALYNQGNNSGGPFRLKRYPKARRAIKKLIADPRYRARTGD